MRFVLKAIFWIFIVGMFMPSEEVRASLPELPRERAERIEIPETAAAAENRSLCDRSPETCEAIGESRILADIAGAAVEIGVKQVMESNSLAGPSDSVEPAEPAAPADETAP